MVHKHMIYQLTIPTLAYLVNSPSLAKLTARNPKNSMNLFLSQHNALDLFVSITILYSFSVVV
jgi:hypothetical protein